jgi:putative flippase GtrA
MTGRETASTDGRQLRSPTRHWGGFLVSGAIAFSTDAAILETTTRLLHWHPLLARLVAISLAMIAGWLAHRTLTFALRSRPTAMEFARYAAAAWSAAAINYALFATILLLRPGTWPLVALFIASGAAAVFSYLAMRFGVFRGRR